MLSDHDRHTLAEIERHLQEDPALRRTFGHRLHVSRRGPRAFVRSWRAMPGIRRVWVALLAMSLVLMVATVALQAPGAVFECAAVAVLIGMWLRSTGKTVEPPAGRGSVPDRRT